MRFAVFDGNRLGVLDPGDRNGLVDVTDLVPGPCGPGGPLQRLIEEGRVVGRDDLAGRPRRPLSDVVLDAPLPRPGKVVGAPVNYRDHQAEMREEHSIADLGVFLKASSSVVGPDGVVELPYSDVRTDQEGELVVVIGRRGRHIPAGRAIGHVFGYTCGLDMTVRSTEDRSARKSFDTFSPLGPYVVTTDEIDDPGRLDLTCRVGGSVRQHTSTAALIFGVPELVAYTSSVMTLHPGDVIFTGTPAGVGPVSDGDRVEVDIEGVGLLAVTVSAAGARPYARRPRPTLIPAAAE
ncbi:fumarylacetoacetate hydrolase family protein [Streptomyces spongiae]|uniref:Fumarylacetoacetate hydrolase family protein n=1 Tax=Streptomyces spongiae TaxID=565072 RepID=A0A5N8XB87_9ACTN|nr:fumarylacetoacetate hydrolase family protein [Streptomyces spongiae]MPY56178.1 fumarylacetoacetate hydrolase family protein [Streptomyces spongiae]